MLQRIQNKLARTISVMYFLQRNDNDGHSDFKLHKIMFALMKSRDSFGQKIKNKFWDPKELGFR